MNVLIIGASRGIGLEFTRQYTAGGAKVTATARTEEALSMLKQLGAKAIALDVTIAESTSRLAWQIDGGAFDVAIFCAGIFGPRTGGLEPPSDAEFDSVMRTNVLGPLRVIPQIAESLARNGRLAVLSSLMGSIGSRTSTGGWLYRASKAALNSVLKDTSLALAGRAICVSFHPGWVKTDMGGASANLDVKESVSSMRRTIVGLQPEDNGRFFAHDGSSIPW